MSTKSVKFTIPVYVELEGQSPCHSPKTLWPSKTSAISKTTQSNTVKQEIKHPSQLSVKPVVTIKPTVTITNNEEEKPKSVEPPKKSRPSTFTTSSGMRTKSSKEIHSRIGVQPSVNAETGQLQQTEPPTSTSISTKKSSPTVKASIVAEKLRHQTNSTSLVYARAIKYQVAKLHEYLLKVEEEIKQMNKGRRTLELAIQDTRKTLSINQQSLSTHQKRTRGNEDVIVKLFREEARTLSSCKRELEGHLQTIRHQLQSLDNVRKLLKNKISSSSKSLHLDAQSFKIYDGPIVSSSSVTKQRHYTTSYPQPKEQLEVEVPAQLFTNVTDTIQASKTVRSEIRNLVSLVHSQKIEAHEKVNSTLSHSIEAAKAQKRDIVLEKGQLRLQQNSLSHQMHTTEISLGLVSGPILFNHRSVSEREDRPLSHIRPASAAEEFSYTKDSKAKLTRQLSASQIKGSSITATEQKLVSKYQEHSMSASLDSQMLRVRKMSLDNRWVC